MVPPKGDNFGVKSEKLVYLLKHFLVFSCAYFRQTENIVKMIKEGYTKLLNFILPNPRAGAPVLGYGNTINMVSSRLHHFFQNLLL